MTFYRQKLLGAVRYLAGDGDLSSVNQGETSRQSG